LRYSGDVDRSSSCTDRAGAWSSARRMGSAAAVSGSAGIARCPLLDSCRASARARDHARGAAPPRSVGRGV